MMTMIVGQQMSLLLAMLSWLALGVSITCFGTVLEAKCNPAHSYPRLLPDLATHISQPSLPTLIRHFLYDQLNPDGPLTSSEVPLDACPLVSGPISVFHSAVATFFAPSDNSGIWGMRHERIRSTPVWRKKAPRRDCAYAINDQNKEGFLGMSIVRIHLLFSFGHLGVEYPCALVEWYERTGQQPDEDIGMWVVKPETRGRHAEPVLSVLHLDCLLRGAHLIPVYGQQPLPPKFSYTYSLNCFEAFYVNKYIDNHANVTIF
jgi:hypothetical protein